MALLVAPEPVLAILWRGGAGRIITELALQHRWPKICRAWMLNWGEIYLFTMPLQQLKQEIESCMAADVPRLWKQFQRLENRQSAGQPIDQGSVRLNQQIETSMQRCAIRRAGLPVPDYQLSLPVSDRRQEIIAAIGQHQVVILCGATGSGKTTQLPKLCLELGRGIRGKIGHTQPRRIAARSLTSRIAEELHTEIGQTVGYKIRFQDRINDNSYIKVMTDGILLAETRSDPEFREYDTLIIDEAHERSLNIDFLIGYLHRLLPKRPDLKLIITSATIDPQRFSKHFNTAPVIEVSGRTFPVDMRYRPVVGDAEDKDREQGQAIIDAVDELAREGPGDILIFLAGERDIRDTAELLRKHHPPHTEILPLYARLSVDQQNKVFKQHKGRRIVLATNVAETSLTVPGVRYVVDIGTARISRYSYRTKVQRLPIESISQASANQRSGRCGRVAAGICIRLYSEEDFNSRTEFTEPEIQRTNLAAVILQMAALKLGDVESFPFLDPPDVRFVRDAFKLLQELGATDAQKHLTDIGRKLAHLPLDPRIGRMVLAASERGCLREVLIIAAGLTIPDPRERPLESAAAADEKQILFRHDKSDFLGYVQLWNIFHEQKKHLSQNKLRKWCRGHFISYIRMREWHDIHSQLYTLCKELRLQLNDAAAEYEAVHRALLPGLLGNVALKNEDREYTGARNLKLNIFPGSSLAKKPPQWVMGAELVETGKRYLRTLASIDPGWVEAAAGSLLKRSYSEPHWSQKKARVMAYERVTLYGLPLAIQRKVNYSSIDPAISRELFIRHALVLGEYRSRADFALHNQKIREELADLEAKARRPDLLIEEQAVFDYFDARIPQKIVSGASFERWLKLAAGQQADSLKLNRELLLRRDDSGFGESHFPDHLEIHGIRLQVHYRFTPGHQTDGLCIDIPVAALNQFSAADFEWLVPGLLREKVVQLIKSLPKQWRRHFVPVPDFASACIDALVDNPGSLIDFLGASLKRMSGIEIPVAAWQTERLTSHLFASFRVMDEQGKILDEASDLVLLQDKYATQAGQDFQKNSARAFNERAVIDWDFGDLPESIEFLSGAIMMRGYPALEIENDKIMLKLFDQPAVASAAHHLGVLRLFENKVIRAIKDIKRGLPDIQQQCLWYAPLGNCEALTFDITQAAVAQAFLSGNELPRTEQDFQQRLEAGRPKLAELANQIGVWSAGALSEYHQLNRQLKSKIAPYALPVASEIRQQLDSLIYPGFVSQTPNKWLPHLARYIQAARLRLEKCGANTQQEKVNSIIIHKFLERYQTAQENNPRSENLNEFRWLIEELRVSYFAQALKTAVKVSENRLEKYWQDL